MLQPFIRRSRGGMPPFHHHFACAFFRALCVFAAALCVIEGSTLCPADEPDKREPDKQEIERRSRHRLEVMQKAIDDLEVSSNKLPAAALKLGKAPLLRYSDPTRGLQGEMAGLVDGGVWRMGETGRPTALVTLEIYRVQKDKTILSHEFDSLTPLELAVSSSRGRMWNPKTTDLKITPVPDGPRPANSPKARLAQMRQISRRFAVHGKVDKEQKSEYRLLSQPIDRYSDEKAGLLDGAVFAFANGTNPELALFLEASDEQWSYGVVRLSAAVLFADLDGRQFYQVPAVAGLPFSAPYLGMAYPIAFEE